jgi:predicted short-subunit dehydrogenase-like oxidoreductase (DUF2520 family)
MPLTKSIQSISIVGSGKVAHYLALEWHKYGYHIAFIVARNAKAGKALAKQCGAKYSADSQSALSSDVVVLAVSDDAIAAVQKPFKGYKGLLLHCAGSVNMQVLSASKRRGVIYPLQSVQSAPMPKDFTFLIEAEQSKDLSLIKALLKACQLHFVKADSAQRLHYHLAAVIVNNFTNALISIADQLISDFDLQAKPLQAMLQKTVQTALQKGGYESQTGPAKRGDFGTLKQHEQLLKQQPLVLAVYKSLSAYIYHTHQTPSKQ